jgi:hypothetical protein
VSAEHKPSLAESSNFTSRDELSRDMVGVERSTLLTAEQPALSVSDARALLEEHFENKQRQLGTERGGDMSTQSMANTAVEAPPEPRQQQRNVTKRIWKGIAVMLTGITAGGFWVHTQSKDENSVNRRPAATAQPSPGFSNEVKPVDAATTLPTVPSSAEIRPATSTTVEPAKTEVINPKPVSPELRQQMGREFHRLAVIEDLKEVGRFQTEHGDAVMVSIDGAQPTISRAELSAVVNYFDQESARPVQSSYELTLEDGSTMTVPYSRSNMQPRTRIFVFAGESTDLRKVEPNVPAESYGFTKDHTQHAPAEVVTIVQATGKTIAHDRDIIYQEVCQATEIAKLDPAFVEKLKQTRPNLERLNFQQSPEASFNRQMVNLRLAIQDLECASRGWAMGAAKQGISYAEYRRQVANKTHGLFAPTFDLRYIPMTETEYGNMRTAVRSIK